MDPARAPARSPSPLIPTGTDPTGYCAEGVWHFQIQAQPADLPALGVGRMAWINDALWVLTHADTPEGPRPSRFGTITVRVTAVAPVRWDDDPTLDTVQAASAAGQQLVVRAPTEAAAREDVLQRLRQRGLEPVNPNAPAFVLVVSPEDPTEDTATFRTKVYAAFGFGKYPGA